MKKYLVVTMPDHTRWRIPAQLIAEHYAKYFAAHYPEASQDVFDDDVTFVLSADYELTNWASGNMNWSDVVAVAERLPDESVECDYERAWVNAVKEVVMLPFEAKVID